MSTLKRKLRIVWEKMQGIGAFPVDIRSERYLAKSLNGGTGWRVYDYKQEKFLSDAEVRAIPDDALRSEKLLDA